MTLPHELPAGALNGIAEPRDPWREAIAFLLKSRKPLNEVDDKHKARTELYPTE